MPKFQPKERVRAIVRSHVPLGEDEEAFDSVKLKVEHRKPLSKLEEKLLERLAVKAEKWEDEVKSSSDTEPEDTLGG